MKARTLIRLYAPPLVLLVWAVLWFAGLRGDIVVVVGLVGTAAAYIVSELERTAQRLRGGSRADSS
jgi:hypothetical protein